MLWRSQETFKYNQKVVDIFFKVVVENFSERIFLPKTTS